jgi:DNA-binding IclR family transcriptional regulator
MTTIPPSDRKEATADTLRILKCIESNDGINTSELADEVGIQADALEAHLASLESEGYVVIEDGRCRLGLNFIHVSSVIRRKSAYQHASDKVDELAEKTSFRSYFVVEERGRGIYFSVNPGKLDVRTKSAVGNWIPLHAAAAGKSILSALPEERVHKIIDKWGLSRETENTITEPAALSEELERIRERGYATNREEQTKGLQAVGVPVVGINDDVIGGLSVGGPVHRMDEDWFSNELPDILLAASNELELLIAYS